MSWMDLLGECFFAAIGGAVIGALVWMLYRAGYVTFPF